MNKTILALILSLVCSIAVAQQQPANEYYILRHESAFGTVTTSDASHRPISGPGPTKA